MPNVVIHMAKYGERACEHGKCDMQAKYQKRERKIHTLWPENPKISRPTTKREVLNARNDVNFTWIFIYTEMRHLDGFKRDIEWTKRKYMEVKALEGSERASGRDKRKIRLHSMYQVTIDANKYLPLFVDINCKYRRTEKYTRKKKIAKLMCLIGIIIWEFGFEFVDTYYTYNTYISTDYVTEFCRYTAKKTKERRTKNKEWKKITMIGQWQSSQWRWHCKPKHTYTSAIWTDAHRMVLFFSLDACRV